MLDIIIDTLKDTIKLLPFLFIAFIIIEVIEHRLSNKNKGIIKKSGKYGPVFGGILGVIPQCGFSTMATNLYVTRIVSLGTLVSIYLSCSDEMLPILLSRKVDISIIISILFIKMAIGIISGIIIDVVMRKIKKINNKFVYDICDEENCHCDKHNIIKSSLSHTLKIGFFVLLINFILNMVFFYVGEDFLSKILLNGNVLSSFVIGLIGLIPNCGSSVIITELYLNGAISLGATLAGLLAGSGVSLFVLFKTNKILKENLLILGLVYGIGAISGMVIDILDIIL